MSDNPTSDESGSNRRADPRLRTFKGAYVVFNGGFSAMECTVRNLSEGGAMLEFSGVIALPNEFTLFMKQDGQGRPCKVAWRSGSRIGVAFTGPPIEKAVRSGPPPKRRDEGY